MIAHSFPTVFTKLSIALTRDFAILEAPEIVYRILPYDFPRPLSINWITDWKCSRGFFPILYKYNVAVTAVQLRRMSSFEGSNTKTHQRPKAVSVFPFKLNNFVSFPRDRSDIVTVSSSRLTEFLRI